MAYNCPEIMCHTLTGTSIKNNMHYVKCKAQYTSESLGKLYMVRV